MDLQFLVLLEFLELDFKFLGGKRPGVLIHCTLTATAPCLVQLQGLWLPNQKLRETSNRHKGSQKDKEEEF